MPALALIAAGAHVALAAGPPAAAPATTNGVGDTRVTLDPSAAVRRFHGHGALSAGASSRLLIDYPEPHRGDVLDYLFKPQWGANLAILKVEIGGDTQSTDGTEPSHKHYRGEPSRCQRGYEYWLATEAKKRNPDIAIYALSWGVPGWVGAGTTCPDIPANVSGRTSYGCNYCSKENIAYQVAWVDCMNASGLQIDYLGVWNERTWCGTGYVSALRSALDAAGHGATTTIVAPDGGPSSVDLQGRTFAEQYNASAELRAAAPIMGFHYPCGARPGNPYTTILPPRLMDEAAVWASEDYSHLDLSDQDPQGGRGWQSGAYWGHRLNQNFVRMNMTTTIAWALLWSVLPGFACDGDGLTIANEPWTGHYSVDAAIWTSAHWGQFVKPGWRLFAPGAGSGLLPNGGSYVSAVELAAGSDKVVNFTVVLETLNVTEMATHCPVSPNGTLAQSVEIVLTSDLAAAVPRAGLAVWKSTEAEQFVAVALVHPTPSAGGSATLRLDVDGDAMYTVTTVQTGRKGQAASSPPDSAPLGLPYEETFDGYGNDTMPRYFSDQAGSWSVEAGAAPGGGGGGGELVQWVRQRPGNNSWGAGSDRFNSPPVTFVGSLDWGGYETCVSATMDGCVGSDGVRADCWVMLCAQSTSFGVWAGGPPTSLCLQANSSGLWALVGYSNQGRSWSRTEVASGTLPAASAEPAGQGVASRWMRLCLTAAGCHRVSSASIDGVDVVRNRTLNASLGLSGQGRVTLGSGWHTARFDNLTVTPELVPPGGSDLFDCISVPNSTQNYRGFVGGLLRFSNNGTIAAVARYCGGPTKPPVKAETAEVVLAVERPTGALLDGPVFDVVAAVNVTMSPGNCDPQGGFVWANLPRPVAVVAGRGYVLAADNTAGWSFCGAQIPEVSGRGVTVEPIYSPGPRSAVHGGTASWTLLSQQGAMYGPLNGKMGA